MDKCDGNEERILSREAGSSLFLHVQNQAASRASVGDVVHRVNQERNPAQACCADEQNETEYPLHLSNLDINNSRHAGLAGVAPDIMARLSRGSHLQTLLRHVLILSSWRLDHHVWLILNRHLLIALHWLSHRLSRWWSHRLSGLRSHKWLLFHLFIYLCKTIIIIVRR